MKKPIPLWVRESGRLYELHILLAIFMISVAVGFGRYSKHGISGFVLGSIFTAALIVLGGIVLFFGIFWLGRLHQILEKLAAYRILLYVLGHIFRLLMFMGFGAFSWMLVAMRFGWDSMWNNNFIPIMAAVTGVILFVIHQLFRDSFWQGFRIACGAVLFALLGSVFGLVLEPMHWHLGKLAGADLGAVLGLLLYGLGLVWLKFTHRSL